MLFLNIEIWLWFFLWFFLLLLLLSFVFKFKLCGGFLFLRLCWFLNSFKRRCGDGFCMCFWDNDFLFMGWNGLFVLLIWGFRSIWVGFWFLFVMFELGGWVSNVFIFLELWYFFLVLFYWKGLEDICSWVGVGRFWWVLV